MNQMKIFIWKQISQLSQAVARKFKIMEMVKLCVGSGFAGLKNLGRSERSIIKNGVYVGPSVVDIIQPNQGTISCFIQFLTVGGKMISRDARLITIQLSRLITEENDQP